MWSHHTLLPYICIYAQHITMRHTYGTRKVAVKSHVAAKSKIKQFAEAWSIKTRSKYLKGVHTHEGSHDTA
jgi:hypothetical protein